MDPELEDKYKNVIIGMWTSILINTVQSLELRGF